VGFTLTNPAITLHDELDIAVLAVGAGHKRTAGETLPPALSPQPLDLDDLVQIAGYGVDDEGQFGVLQFATERILRITDETITVTADGLAGACAGDSGGPLLIRGQSGEVEVLGVLSDGTASCRGEDTYIRLDALSEWLDQQGVEPEQNAGIACADLGNEGMCSNDRAVYCEHEGARSDHCQELGEVCGWDSAARGFRCIPPGVGPCGEINALGVCREGQAIRCESGALVWSDCAACGAACVRSPKTGRATCLLASQ
jgi:hypothetical protein